MDTKEMPVLDSETDDAPSVDPIAHEAATEAPPSRWGITTQALIVGVLAAIAGWFMHVLSERNERDAALPVIEQQSPDDAATTLVTTAPVSVRNVPRTIDVVGTLNCFEEIPISAEVDGTVLRLHADVSKRITTGDLLMEIDPTDFQLSVEEAERMLQVELAQLGQTEPPADDWSVESLPGVLQAQARLNMAENKLKRLQTLDADNATSKADLDSATGEFKAAEAERNGQILTAKSRLATLRMKLTTLEIARQKLKDSRIVAPPLEIADMADGTPPISEPYFVVAERNVSPGEFVRSGTQVMKIVVDSRLKLRASVREQHAPDVVLGQTATIETAALTQPVSGVVTKIYPVVDPSKRTFDVEIQVDNRDGKLRPGNFAKASILVQENENATTVPLEAIVSSAGINKLFLVENNSAHEVQVQLGRQSDQWVEIVEPELPVDKIVITSGQLKLFQGSPVEVREPAAAEESPAPDTDATPSGEAQSVH